MRSQLQHPIFDFAHIQTEHEIGGESSFIPVHLLVPIEIGQKLLRANLMAGSRFFVGALLLDP